ncbi:hypothetical protein PybrP1_005785 [[Pythium] brassicae (nom. inval.)]|nr:hypothetical protein PybrP1_005785 [[Pythium] brassicae (nom. inval.)]
MEALDDHAARILRCVCLEAPAAPELVRRRYKALAVLVHPDKNKAAGAEEAFKRLSEAYVCLSDESSQRSYLRSLATGRSAAARRPPPPPPASRSAPPAYPRKRRKKASDEAKPPPPPGPPPPPRRQRTPEEIWRAFQEEEERVARREFLAKGFERTFASSSPTGSQDDGAAGSSCNGNAPGAADAAAAQESVLNSGLDEKAQSWTRWQKQRGSTPPPPPDDRCTVSAAAVDEVNGGSSGRPSSSAQASGDPICCLLCRRKFPSLAALSRHDALSELHQENLKRLASS